MNNSLTWAISGTVIIKGNVELKNGASFVVSGSLTVDGNFTAEQNVTITNSGVIAVGGDFTAGDNTGITNTGDITVGGDFTSGQNTQVLNTGDIAVGDAVTVGGGSSSLTSSPPATFTAGSCASSSSFCSGVDVPQPITLLFFTGASRNDQVLLTWATATELNFDYFSVERSANGLDFSEIEQIKGHGTTNERNDYQMADYNPLVGKNYYRLKSVDFDGYTEYFNVVLVDFSGEKTFTIFPNPSDGTSLTFALNFVPDSNTSITIFDNYSGNIGVIKPTNAWESVTFSNSLKSGLYFAKIVSKDFVKVERFIVQ